MTRVSKGDARSLDSSSYLSLDRNSSFEVSGLTFDMDTKRPIRTSTLEETNGDARTSTRFAPKPQALSP